MLNGNRLSPGVLVVLTCLVVGSAVWAAEPIPGEPLDPASYGPSYIESMRAVVARDRLAARPMPKEHKGQPGAWEVPSRGASAAAHSGTHYAVNKWGDTRMGIGFPEAVDVQGVWVMGQAAQGAWTTGLRVLGYRADEQVAATDWFNAIGPEWRWFSLELRGVDRIEFLALPVLQGAGWFAIDDLTIRETTSAAGGQAKETVVTFDDLQYETSLTDTHYAGLTWESGKGEFGDQGVHGPISKRGATAGGEGRELDQSTGTLAVTPTLQSSFQGVIRGDAGSMSYPPDTDGAIGPQHFVETVNRNFAIYNRWTGAQLVNVLLGSFLPGSNGDPRVLYDQYSGRWFVLVTDFSASATHYLAVSLTSDPTGSWFKTSFVTAQGSDAGKWPDYPTLGVDANGVYTASYMVGSSSTMTIFALNKAPLIASPPSLGTVTAFRSLPFEGAIQPAHTFGTATGEYLVSTADATHIRVRRVNPPLTAPTLTEVGQAVVTSYSDAADAPALGSSTPLDTVDSRLMMAVYRDGKVWTAHTIAAGAGAGCRWYSINVPACTVAQSGTVSDSTRWYFFPSIMVNANGDAVMGFTGSSSTQYPSGYFTGRVVTDPAGQMAAPVLYHAGVAAQNNIDSYGRNRWGDYSYTTLDPTDPTVMWMIQEYGHATDIWGTYVAQLSFGPPDCNHNGIPDAQDIANGTSTDCNSNGVPDECESTADCNGNGVADFCDLIAGTSQDCNGNSIPDECDIASGPSVDCDGNGIPDECEIGTTVVTYSFPLDTTPGWTTQALWAFGHPTGGGGEHGSHDPTNGHTGTNVYGYNLSGDYTSGMSEQHLTSTAINCTGLQTVQLSFWRWLGVEQPSYDHAYVRASNNGTTWTTVWQNTGEVADSAWQLMTYDISAVAANQPTVYLRWTMGTTDSSWVYCGWNIDDIVVQGTRIGGGPGDCNGNAIPDACDIANGTAQDCNHNGVPDSCDIANGTSQDANANGIPDECEGPAVCRGDCNCDGRVGFADIDFFVAAIPDNQSAWAALHEARFGHAPTCSFANCDANNDGHVNFTDIDPFVALIPSACP